MSAPKDWQKSTFSGGGDGNACVELAMAPNQDIHLRESDHPATELAVGPALLAHLLRTVKSGQFS
ncbi:DUF397 domain-containing protein [Streptomyces sp. NPDC048436]|uniref:DUF397 domain-containing protein n=1 Tax=Streptomyces sp. NPDC048436 TaxID=3365550 RepID=UPI00371CF873